MRFGFDEINKRMRKAIIAYDMIADDTPIMVGLSGGKDSMLLAKCMQEILRHGKMEFGLKFLVMDPGYKTENRQLIEENARTMGIPALVDTDMELDRMVTGMEAIVNGYTGEMILEPSTEQIEDAKEQIESQQKEHKALQALIGKEENAVWQPLF